MKFFSKKIALDEKDIQGIFSDISSQYREHLPELNEALAYISASKKIMEKDLRMAQKKHDTAPFKLLRKDKRKRFPYSQKDVVFYQRLLAVMLEGREDLEEKLKQMVIQAQEIKQRFDKQREEIITQYADAFKEKKLPLLIDYQKLSFQLPTPIPTLKKKEKNFPLKYEIAAYDREKRETIRFIIADLLRDVAFKANHSVYPRDNYQKTKRFVQVNIRKANASSNSYLKVFSHSLQKIYRLSITQDNLIREHFQARYRQVLEMIAHSPYAIDN